jgi:hypothetical protein
MILKYSLIALLTFASLLKSSAQVSEVNSIAAFDSSKGVKIVKDIETLDVYFSEQKSITPIIELNSEAFLTIKSKKGIASIWEKIWKEDSAKPRLWPHGDCSLVLVARFKRGEIGYWHVYLRHKQVILMTPFTGYDSATYSADSLYELACLVYDLRENQSKDVMP